MSTMTEHNKHADTSSSSSSSSSSSPSTPPASDRRVEAAAADCGGGLEGRERLKRHRVEVAGRVWIPDKWGQEDLLKDWIDCSVFDESLAPKGIMSARKALVEEGRRAARSCSSGLEVGTSC